MVTLNIKYAGRIDSCDMEFSIEFEEMTALKDYLTNLRDFQFSFSEDENSPQYILQGAAAVLNKEGSIAKINASIVTHEDIQREILAAQQEHLGPHGPGGQIIPFPTGDESV
jgi:hypothetical protein